MNPEVKTLWLEALRSGGYVQGTKGLRRQTSTGVTWCCMGVLCDLAAYDEVNMVVQRPVENGVRYRYDGNLGILPVAVQNWAGLDSCNPTVAGASLSLWNDGSRGDDNTPPRRGYTFEEIADLIEEYL